MKRMIFLLLFFPSSLMAYEISGSPFATHDAPLPEFKKSLHEKFIYIDPNEHVWGAYNAEGKLIRWGIATTGARWCADTREACATKAGKFRVYSLGSANCISSKFPIAEGGAPMPYCMYFNGSEAIHGAYEVAYGNKSHGCVRVHINDAKWLRYQFVEGPNAKNQYRGTKIIVATYRE